MASDLKPPMPKPAPTLELPGVSARLMSDFARYSSGSLGMTMAGIGGEIKDEGDNNVGSVYGALGGGIVVTIGTGKDSRVWAVNMRDIWKAVYEADQEQYPTQDGTSQ